MITMSTNTLEKYRGYIEDLYGGRSALRQKEFVSNTEWKDFVPVVEDDSARFLQLMLRMKKPEKILEIGTSIGFSATSMALTAREYGGKITTVEFDAAAAEQARRNFERSGVDDTVQIRFGDARRIIPGLPDSSFDLVFQDADKRLYPALLNDCIRVLKTGGIFIADDTLFPAMELDPKWDGQVEAVREFNRLVVDVPGLDSTLLPIGDGMTVAVKK